MLRDDPMQSFYLFVSIDKVQLTHSDLQLLQRLLQNLASRWKYAGRALGLSQEILQQIAKDEASSGTIACLNKILLMWVSQLDKPATLQALLKALSSLQAHAIAQRVQGMCIHTKK